MTACVAPLPIYPSTRIRASLSPSQHATFHQNVSSALAQTLELPPAQRDTAAILAFISSYAKDAAQQVLQSLIWDDESSKTKLSTNLTQVERSIRQRVFVLAERQAAVGSLDLQSLLDLSVVYSSTNPSRLRSLLASAFSQRKTLISAVRDEALPAFTDLLSTPTQGLYGLRKTAHILSCLLHPGPTDLVREFARSKAFVLALAKSYDHGLSSISQSYGGLRVDLRNNPTGALDGWERIFLHTKVALIDSFHVLIRGLLEDVAAVSAAGTALATQCEPAFEVVFALLELRPAHADGTTPFLDRTLLADYQHAYNLSHTLSDVLRRADDSRTQLLEVSLRQLDNAPSEGTTGSNTGPGALRLILRSSGVPPGIDNIGRGPAKTAGVNSKGKEKAAGPSVVAIEDDGTLDLAVSQVQDILPDQPPDYLRFLLSHSDYPYYGNAERLIEALLEGTAPAAADVEAAMRAAHSGAAACQSGVGSVPPPRDEFVYTRERRNVFDDEKMDLSQLRVGKKTDESPALLHDREFMEQMKADILRRAEEISDSEEEEVTYPGVRTGAGRGKGRDVAFEDELDDDDVVRVRDGEESEGDEENDDEDSPSSSKASPETILELAYLRDPALFNRDGQTRKSKAWADLKAQTGWDEQQIDGWKIMLDRNPKKDKILAKHEFSGNNPGALPRSETPSRGGGDRGGRGARRGGGRGRGGRGGHSQGGSGASPSTGGDGGGAKDRAFKDRNKASRGNNNRKRGHDKKMAKAGGPS